MTLPARWATRGTCADIGPKRWAALSRADQRRTCRECPVLIKCLAWSINDGHPVTGITAGLDDHERARLVRATH